jgi:hypothetical protein
MELIGTDFFVDEIYIGREGSRVKGKSLVTYCRSRVSCCATAPRRYHCDTRMRLPPICVFGLGTCCDEDVVFVIRKAPGFRRQKGRTVMGALFEPVNTKSGA